MELKNYQECPECSNAEKALALKIGGRQFAYCPDCYENKSNLNKAEVIEHIDELINNGGDFTCSVIENGDWIFKEFDFKNSDFRGSFFVGCDLSLANFKRANLSFCNFIYCKLRRTKLFNSSLRFSRFDDCVVRQIDLTNADCRWICANAGYILKKHSDDLGQELSALLARIQKARNGNSKNRIKNDECVYLLNAFGICKLDENCEDKAGLAKIKKEIEKFNRIELACAAKERQRKKNNKPTEEAKSDWSGTTLQEADLSYAVFDQIIGHEINFEECDLHQATFEGADLTRSSFLSASFSRHTPSIFCCNPKPPEPDKNRFKQTKFTACALEGTNLCDLHFLETDFSVANMSSTFADRAVFEGCEMENVDMSGGVARGAHFVGTKLKGGNLEGIVATKAWFSLGNHQYDPGDVQNEQFVVPYPYTFQAEKKIDGKENGETDLSGANLKASSLDQAKFKEVTLSGALFTGTSLNHSDFTEANSSGVSFEACLLEGCIFEKTILAACEFKDSRFSPETKFLSSFLSSADFSGTKIEEIEFQNVSCDSADFSDCTLYNVKFIFDKKNTKSSNKKNIDCTGMNFSSCEMNSVEFVSKTESKKDIDFSNASFENSQINNTSFNNIMLRTCSFDGSFLENVNFNNVELNSSSFKKVLNDELSIKFIECKAERTDFSQSTIKELIVVNSNFQNSYFFYTKINKGDFNDTRFSGTSIKSSELDCCNFNLNREKEEHIFGCDFSDSIFKGSTFTSTNGMIKISGIFNRTVLNSNDHESTTRLKNIILEASTLEFAMFEIDCDCVLFQSCNFEDSKVRVNKINTLAFDECYFIKSNLQFQLSKNKNWEKVIFNGTKFENVTLPENGIGQCYLECSFKDLYFLKDKDWIKEWSDAILIQCSFEDIYFQDLFYQKSNDHGHKPGKEGPEENIKNFVSHIFWDGQDAKKINSDIEQLICKLRTFTDLFKDLFTTKAIDLDSMFLTRIEKLYTYNNYEQRNTVYEAWFHAKIDFIKKIRKEMMNQHHFDTASDLYVLERDQELYEKISLRNIFFSLFKPRQYHRDCIAFFILTLIFIFFFNVNYFFFNYTEHPIVFFGVIFPSIILLSIFYSKRKIYNFFQDIISHIYKYFLRTVFLYGESFGRIIINALIIIFMFSISYWYVNSTLQFCLTECNNTSNSLNFYHSLYFSAVTFSTLGLGDIQPLGVCRALASVQALTGAFFMALFVFTFVRRMASRM